MKKNYLIFIFGVFIFLFLMSGWRVSGLKNAVFTNLNPSITIDDKEYIVSKNIVNKDDIGEQIAKVTKINNVISYSDENNPYKRIGKIYKIKNEDQNKKIAIEINGTIFIAEIVEYKD